MYGTKEVKADMKRILYKKYLPVALSVLAMLFLTCACGGSNGSGNTTFHTKASTAVVSDYDTAVFSFEDYDIPEDLYSSTVTVEYDGDKVVKVTEINVDDMTSEDDDLFEMILEEYDGNLEDTGFAEMDGFTSDVTVEGKVRTESRIFDLNKFDIATFAKYVDMECEQDYISFSDLTEAYEKNGYKKVTEDD